MRNRQRSFSGEIKVLARLFDSNIVTFYHAREIEGHLVMITEYVAGITVAGAAGVGSRRLEQCREERVPWALAARLRARERHHSGRPHGRQPGDHQRADHAVKWL